MKKVTVKKTSISLDPDVLDAAKSKVKDTGQSVSSYINVLIRRDLSGGKETRPNNLGALRALGSVVAAERSR